MTSPPRAISLLVPGAAVIAGCAGNGRELYGGFFVSPGGLTELSYPPGVRGVIGDLSGPAITGDGTIALSDDVGQVLVLNVWGSWCGPCRGEAADLNAAATELVSADVQFLGIDVRDTRTAAEDFINAQQIPNPSVRTLISIRDYPTSSIPSTVVLDRDRRVAHIFLRPVQKIELVRAVTAVVDEPAPAAAGPAR